MNCIPELVEEVFRERPDDISVDELVILGAAIERHLAEIQDLKLMVDSESRRRLGEGKLLLGQETRVTVEAGQKKYKPDLARLVDLLGPTAADFITFEEGWDEVVHHEPGYRQTRPNITPLANAIKKLADAELRAAAEEALGISEGPGKLVYEVLQ